ncbi:hypothetical protein HK405_001183, partial [Cladochytrium tenue]
MTPLIVWGAGVAGPEKVAGTPKAEGGSGGCTKKKKDKQAAVSGGAPDATVASAGKSDAQGALAETADPYAAVPWGLDDLGHQSGGYRPADDLCRATVAAAATTSGRVGTGGKVAGASPPSGGECKGCDSTRRRRGCVEIVGSVQGRCGAVYLIHRPAPSFALTDGPRGRGRVRLGWQLSCDVVLSVFTLLPVEHVEDMRLV